MGQDKSCSWAFFLLHRDPFAGIGQRGNAHSSLLTTLWVLRAGANGFCSLHQSHQQVRLPRIPPRGVIVPKPSRSELLSSPLPRRFDRPRNFSELDPRSAPYWKLRLLRRSAGAAGGATAPRTARLEALLGFRREAKQIRSAEQSMHSQARVFLSSFVGVC